MNITYIIPLRIYKLKIQNQKMAHLNLTYMSLRLSRRQCIIKRANHMVQESTTCSWVKQSNSKNRKSPWLKELVLQQIVAYNQFTLSAWMEIPNQIHKINQSKIHWKRIHSHPNQWTNWNSQVELEASILLCPWLCRLKIVNNMFQCLHRQQVNLTTYKAKNKTFIIAVLTGLLHTIQNLWL